MRPESGVSGHGSGGAERSTIWCHAVRHETRVHWVAKHGSIVRILVKILNIGRHQDRVSTSGVYQIGAGAVHRHISLRAPRLQCSLAVNTVIVSPVLLTRRWSHVPQHLATGAGGRGRRRQRCLRWEHGQVARRHCTGDRGHGSAVVRSGGLAPHHLLSHQVSTAHHSLSTQTWLGGPGASWHWSLSWLTSSTSATLLYHQLLGSLRPHHVQGSLTLIKTGRFRQWSYQQHLIFSFSSVEQLFQARTLVCCLFPSIFADFSNL